jgi:sorbitol-specific phosphotransferase system component IIA
MVPYIGNYIRESFQSIFKNSQNSTEDDLLLQIINPINPQDTKDICLFIKESFTKRETFKGNSLSSS